MPIYRYKTFEEAEEALWNFDPDEAYYRKVFAMLETGRKLLGFKCKPGIQKFKTFEEANEALEKELLELQRSKNR